MTSFYQTMNKGLFPISQYRYPHKYDATENWSLDDTSLVCRSFNFKNRGKNFTLDCLNYIGDDQNQIRIHLEDAILNFLFDLPAEHYFKGMESVTHWTLTFNNCEKWGNGETVEYSEVTPTHQFKSKRKDRQRLIFFYNHNKELIVLNSFKDEFKVESKTHTPLDVLLADKKQHKSAV